MGGHAFADSSPLSEPDAERVVDMLRAFTGWTLEPAGSFGFRTMLADLDIIVLDSQFDRKKIAELGETKTYNLGGAGLRFPLGRKFHQVDFFPVVSLEWGRFTRAGAPDSGANRALLLKAAAATYFEPGVDFEIRRGGKQVFRANRTLDQRSGLRRIFQHRLRADRKGLLKNMKSVDAAELFDLTGVPVPDVEVLSDPVAVKRKILGPAPDDVDKSAHSLARHMRASFSPTRVMRVTEALRERGVVFELIPV